MSNMKLQLEKELKEIEQEISELTILKNMYNQYISDVDNGVIKTIEGE